MSAPTEDRGTETAEARAASSEPRWRWWAKRLAPYAIAAGAVTAILREYPPERIATEMARGHVLRMAPFTIPILLVSVAVLGFADVWVFRRCVEAWAAGGNATRGASPTWPRLVRARMAMAPLALIGYTAGVGGYGVWLARVTGSGAAFTSGMVLYTLASDLVAVSTVATLSIWVGGAEVSAGLRYAAPAIVLVLGVVPLIHPSGLAVDKLPTFFRPWRYVPRTVALAQLAVRTTNTYWVSFWTWQAINAFGVPVPLSALTTYLPIILVVGSMPVNVAGFGAVQGAWLMLAPWAESGEQVLAFSVLWQLVFGAGLVVRGLPFLRAVVGEIDRGADRGVDLEAAAIRSRQVPDAGS